MLISGLFYRLVKKDLTYARHVKTTMTVHAQKLTNFLFLSTNPTPHAFINMHTDKNELSVSVFSFLSFSFSFLKFVCFVSQISVIWQKSTQPSLPVEVSQTKEFTFAFGFLEDLEICFGQIRNERTHIYQNKLILGCADASETTKTKTSTPDGISKEKKHPYQESVSS